VRLRLTPTYAKPFSIPVVYLMGRVLAGRAQRDRDAAAPLDSPRTPERLPGFAGFPPSTKPASKGRRDSSAKAGRPRACMRAAFRASEACFAFIALHPCLTSPGAYFRKRKTGHSLAREWPVLFQSAVLMGPQEQSISALFFDCENLKERSKAKAKSLGPGLKPAGATALVAWADAGSSTGRVPLRRVALGFSAQATKP